MAGEILLIGIIGVNARNASPVLHAGAGRIALNSPLFQPLDIYSTIWDLIKASRGDE